MRIKKLMLALLSSALLVACGTTTTTEDSATSDGGSGEEQTQETGSNDESTTVSLSDVDVDDEEAWKQEPAYGTTIQVISGSGCTAPVNVAKENGYYEEEGLDVELLQTQSATIDAVGTGQVALGVGHITSSLIPMSNDVNAQYVGPCHTGCKALYVRADRDDINSAGDMDNMKIGIHDALGASDHNVCLRFLQKEGADPHSVQFVNTEVSASPQAIESGELDGAIYTENYADPFVKDGKLKAVNSLTFDDEFKDEVCCAYFVNKDFMKENPITTKKLVRAVFKANQFRNNDLEGYTEFLWNHEMLSGDKQAGDDFIESLSYDVTTQQMEETLEEIISDYIELGIIEGDMTVEEIMDKVWTPTGLEVQDL